MSSRTSSTGQGQAWRKWRKFDPMKARRQKIYENAKRIESFRRFQKWSAKQQQGDRDSASDDNDDDEDEDVDADANAVPSQSEKSPKRWSKKGLKSTSFYDRVFSQDGLTQSEIEEIEGKVPTVTDSVKALADIDEDAAGAEDAESLRELERQMRRRNRKKKRRRTEEEGGEDADGGGEKSKKKKKKSSKGDEGDDSTEGASGSVESEKPAATSEAADAEAPPKPKDPRGPLSKRQRRRNKQKNRFRKASARVAEAAEAEAKANGDDAEDGGSTMASAKKAWAKATREQQRKVAAKLAAKAKKGGEDGEPPKKNFRRSLKKPQVNPFNAPSAPSRRPNPEEDSGTDSHTQSDSTPAVSSKPRLSAREAKRRRHEAKSKKLKRTQKGQPKLGHMVQDMLTELQRAKP